MPMARSDNLSLSYGLHVTHCMGSHNVTCQPTQTGECTIAPCLRLYSHRHEYGYYGSGFPFMACKSYLQPFRRSSVLKCALHPKIAKNSLKTPF